MSDIHILTSADNGMITTVAFHFPIADTLNPIGLSMRTLVAQNEDTVSKVSNIPAAEQTQLTNGEKIEVVITVPTNQNHSPKEIDITGKYKAMAAEVKSRLANKYNLFGMTVDMPK